MTSVANGVAEVTEASIGDQKTRPAAQDARQLALHRLSLIFQQGISTHGVVILPPMDVSTTLQVVGELDLKFDTIMLDPWYNKGFGGLQEGYLDFFLDVIRRSAALTEHIYFWGFPEIVAPFVERIPEALKLTCWLTWYYKNNPSVIRGWRSAQNACLHLSRPQAILHPERFLNEKQLSLQSKGKLRYMPGPTSVLEDGPADLIEQPLLVGFVGRNEQTGHPSQKPVRVYDQLLQMSMSEGGLLLDPMAGSGTSAVVAKNRGFRAILCDGSEEYTCMIERRTGLNRLDVADDIEIVLGHSRDEKNRHLLLTTTKLVTAGKKPSENIAQGNIF